jgi:hypothetical protein
VCVFTLGGGKAVMEQQEEFILLQWLLSLKKVNHCLLSSLIFYEALFIKFPSISGLPLHMS